MVHRICQVCAVLALIGLASTAVGAADFVFGPETLELTAGEIELFEMSFSSTTAGPFVLYLHNGSGETSRVSAASVELNGAVAVVADDFGEDSPRLARKVELQDGINELALAAGADDWLACIGIPSWTLVTLDAGPGEAGYAMRSLFQQEMARREVLILTTHNLTHAHDDAAIDALLGAYEEVIPYLAEAKRTGCVAALLEGPPIEPAFRVRG